MEKSAFELGDGEIVEKDGRWYFVSHVDEYGVVLKSLVLTLNHTHFLEMDELRSFEESVKDWDTKTTIVFLEEMARDAKKLSNILDDELTRFRKSRS